MLAFDLVDHEWQSINEDGTKYSLLEGDKECGVFTYLFFLPAGSWDTPHWHTGDSRIYVLDGALQLGFSDDFDKSNAKLFNSGALIIVPKNVVHFDGADIDTTILGFGTSPWSTRYI